MPLSLDKKRLGRNSPVLESESPCFIPSLPFSLFTAKSPVMSYKHLPAWKTHEVSRYPEKHCSNIAVLMILSLGWVQLAVQGCKALPSTHQLVLGKQLRVAQMAALSSALIPPGPALPWAQLRPGHPPGARGGGRGCLAW